MRIVVTGAKGMLGSDICRILGEQHQVIGIDRDELDITDTVATQTILEKIHPQLVVHCAAYTDVDAAELNPDEAYRVNGMGTWNVASATANVGATIVYISTDFVFDGEKGEPYTEWDTPNPQSYYAASKYAGERVIQWVGVESYIVRSAWLFGNTEHCFPRQIIKAAKKHSELKVVADQVGTPTYTIDLARAIGELIESPLTGIYHVTNSGMCSWYQFAQKVLELAGMDAIKVKPITSGQWPSPTRRPKYSVLRHYALELQGKDHMRPWDDALAEYMKSIEI